MTELVKRYNEAAKKEMNENLAAYLTKLFSNVDAEVSALNGFTKFQIKIDICDE